MGDVFIRFIRGRDCERNWVAFVIAHLTCSFKYQKIGIFGFKLTIKLWRKCWNVMWSTKIIAVFTKYMIQNTVYENRYVLLTVLKWVFKDKRQK